MNDKIVNTSINLMGKTYQIKCLQKDIQSLQHAAHYVEEKMQTIREGGIFSIDQIAVITTLNMAHQLLTAEQQKEDHLQWIHQRLQNLQMKVEQTLEQKTTMEFSSASF